MIKQRPIIALTGILVLVAALTVAAAPQDSQTTKSKGDHNNPIMKGEMDMMMHSMMARGMMGSGMMGSGMMRNCMMMTTRGGSWSEGPLSDLTFNSRGELLEPLSKKKTEEIARFYLDRLGNPRLKSGQIEEKDSVFEVAIVTKDKSLVDKLLVEKDTGIFYLARD